MENKQFNLSEKIVCIKTYDKNGNETKDVKLEMLFKQDVKEFIRLLKEQAQWNLSGIIGQSITAELHDLIDKFAGEKLT